MTISHHIYMFHSSLKHHHLLLDKSSGVLTIFPFFIHILHSLLSTQQLNDLLNINQINVFQSLIGLCKIKLEIFSMACKALYELGLTSFLLLSHCLPHTYWSLLRHFLNLHLLFLCLGWREILICPGVQLMSAGVIFHLLLYCESLMASFLK